MTHRQRSIKNTGGQSERIGVSRKGGLAMDSRHQKGYNSHTIGETAVELVEIVVGNDLERLSILIAYATARARDPDTPN